jgi:hypothetical protein
MIWAVMAALIVLDAAGLKLAHLSIYPRSLISTLISISFMLALALIYTYVRRDRRIAVLAHMGAVIMGFAASTAILSYIVVTAHQPLIDPYLVAADRAMGLDWRSSYDWLHAHAFIKNILFWAYISLLTQMVALMLLLNFLRRPERGWEMIWLFVVSCAGCLIISAFWPAAGAFGYFQVEADRPYVKTFMALHNGTFSLIGKDPIQGIIQFPSFHAALAILYTYVTRGMRFLFPFFVVLNALLVIATPVIGGHHYADLWGGIALAILTIWIVQKFLSPLFMHDIAPAKASADMAQPEAVSSPAPPA